MAKLTKEERKLKREECRKTSKDFFAKVRAFFIKAFDDAQTFLDNHVEPVLHFVQALKQVVDSPAGDFIVNIIPGKIDDAVLGTLRGSLDQVIALLGIQLECSKEASSETRIRCFIEHLRGLTPEMQSAIYHKIASLLTRLNKGEHTFTDSEIDAMVQLAYNNSKQA